MPDKNGYSSSYDEAKQKYNIWKSKDPLPYIDTALLNSADIADYVRVTGMIYPFYENDLNGATYTVKLKGLCTYFEEQNNRYDKQYIFRVGNDEKDLPNVAENEQKYDLKNKIILKPNSITFLTLEPVFQLPDYLAFRFNLKISHIYKGLLLGTGPIIDPGFQGRLSIPVHNLTSNEYVFKADDAIIDVEVTKVSNNSKWRTKNSIGRLSKYKSKHIPEHRQVIQYIENALGHSNKMGIVSSVVAATNAIRRNAEDAKHTAETAMEKIKNYALIGVIGVVVSVFALIYPTIQLVKSTTDTQENYALQIQELQNQVYELQEQLDVLLLNDDEEK